MGANPYCHGNEISELIANKVKVYKDAFLAAKVFIDSYVVCSHITDEICEKYVRYQKELKKVGEL